ncbi:MAG: HYR domain-containing protein, partial [Bacteroidales bacterium]|nr:HYR domain-containing protein [Bacteroidales bacterium]
MRKIQILLKIPIFSFLFFIISVAIPINKAISQEIIKSRDVKSWYVGWLNSPDSLGVLINNSFSDSEKDSVRAAMQRWNAAGCIPKFKEVTSSSDAQVTINKGPVDDGDAGLCETTRRRSDNKVILAEITISPDHNSPPNPLSLKEVATHELGHALGLRDTDATANASDVMKGSGPTNGSDGNLSQHDSTEMRQAANSITVMGAEPTDKVIAFIPEKAVTPGEFNVLGFDLMDVYPPGSNAFVQSSVDEMLFIEFANINNNILEVGIFTPPEHYSGELYLDITILTPDGLEFSYLGIHYINSNPIPLTFFECPFIIIEAAGAYHIDWLMLHTYPFPDPLRATLVVDEEVFYEVRPNGNFKIDLPPGEHLIELFVDDYQVNSASFSMMCEVPVMPSTITLGQGTDSNSPTGWPTPYGTYFKNFRQQYLILASELSSLGLVEGPITSLAFDVAAMNNCSPMPNFTIQIKHTNAQELTPVFDNEPYQLVWSHPEFLPAEGWNTHQFFEPFFWNGFENVLIDICCDLIPGNYTQNASVFFTPTDFNSCLRFQSDSEIACGTGNNGTLSVNRANMQLAGTIGDCPPPQDLLAEVITATGAILKWTPATNHMAWNVELGYPGFQPGTGQALQSQIGTDVNFWPVEGLEQATDYEFFVQAVCNDGSLSNWSLPGSFTTSCGIFELPFTESFDQAEFPECWSQSFEGGLTSERWNVNNTSNAGGEPFEMKATYQSQIGVSRLITPPLNLEPGAVVLLEFKHFYNDYGDGCTFKIQSSIDGINWIDEGFMFMSGNGDIGPETISIPIGNLSPNTQIAWVIDGNHFQFDNWYIDAVNITTSSVFPIIICPPDIIATNDPGLCLAGFVELGEPTVDDPNGIEIVYNNAPAEGFPVGTTIVTWTAVNLIGDSNSCDQLVLVEDNEPPVIPSIPDIMIENDPADCGAIVEWEPPVPTDNCGVESSESLFQPGDWFPVGETDVTYTATDVHGNQGFSGFRITVIDVEDPDIPDLPDLETPNDPGDCGATLTW